VELRPIDKASDKEPDYRVVQERDGVIVEFGAAWKRSSGKDRDFLSVLLDDPALPASLNAALFLSDRDDRRRSFGSDRPRRRRPQSLNGEFTRAATRRRTQSAPGVRRPTFAGGRSVGRPPVTARADGEAPSVTGTSPRWWSGHLCLL